MIEVVATQNGFYGGARKRVGAIFNIEDGETGSWFERTDGKPLKGRKAPKDAKAVRERVDNSDERKVEDLKADPEKNDLKNGLDEKIGEKADPIEDKAASKSLV